MRFTSILCENPHCSITGTVEVSAEGTSYSYTVCGSDIGWAKRKIAEDFPRRRVLVTRTS